VSGNVVSEGGDIAGSERGFGIELYADTGLVTVQNNIITHELSNNQYLESVNIHQGANNDIVTNNIIYKWGGPADFYDFGSGNITSPNAINQTGYLDPERSVETYMASLGGNATLAAFLDAAGNQSKTNWNPQYTADAVNSYIEAGFATTGGRRRRESPRSPTTAARSATISPMDTTLTVTGTAAANSTVTVFDGTTKSARRR